MVVTTEHKVSLCANFFNPNSFFFFAEPKNDCICDKNENFKIVSECRAYL